jgi:hypothetical protein
MVRFFVALPFLITATISVTLWEIITGTDFDLDNTPKPPPTGVAGSSLARPSYRRTFKRDAY